MQVALKTLAEGAESRQQAIVEVMVDLLLDMEGISVSQGLVYVLDELESYPVSAMRTSSGMHACSSDAKSCMCAIPAAGVDGYSAAEAWG